MNRAPRSQRKPARKHTGVRGLLTTFLDLARPHRLGGLVLLAGLLLETGYDTAFRYSLKVLIDEAIVPGKWQLLVLILVVLAVGAILTQATALGCDQLWARIGSRIMNALRLHIFGHLQRLHMGFHARSRVGDLMARFSTDLAYVESGLTNALPAAIIATGGILFSLVLLFRLEWHLALVTLIGLPLCTLGPRWLGARAVSADYAYKQQEAGLASQVQENLVAQPVIKAYDLQPHMVAEFRGRLETLYTASVRSAFLGYLIQRMPNVAVLFLQLSVIAVGAVMVFRQMLSIGDLVAFQALFTGMSAAVSTLTWVGPNLIAVAGSMRRIHEILDEIPVRRARMQTNGNPVGSRDGRRRTLWRARVGLRRSCPRAHAPPGSRGEPVGTPRRMRAPEHGRAKAGPGPVRLRLHSGPAQPAHGAGRRRPARRDRAWLSAALLPFVPAEHGLRRGHAEDRGDRGRPAG